MPTTYNGIGTHYYGKKNKSARSGACRACGRAGTLTSYDTRLWFVVVFIPVIPLGRKRIIDQCPSCSRHFAADAAKFEAARQQETAEAVEQYRRDPAPESALRAHATLLGFHDREAAAFFRAEAVGDFPDSAGLMIGLASHLEQISAHEEAAGLYEGALGLQPDLPDARLGAAKYRIVAGDLDEARPLLAFLEAPGAGQRHPLHLLDALAAAFQKAGRHEEALELAKVLLREVPEIGREHRFRKFVGASERAVGLPDSILPESGRTLLSVFDKKNAEHAPWQRKLAWTVVVGLVLAGSLAISNEYIRRHRTLHITNASGQPAQVQVDDQPPVTVNGLGKIAVAEGPHRVRITGPFDESHDIEVASGYFERWSSSPAWVLNPGGEAILADWALQYASDPLPGSRTLIVGTQFVHRPHVDYLFESPPSSIRVKGHNTVVQKSQLEWVQGMAVDVEALDEIAQGNPAAALAFGEAHLRRNPGKADLLESYLQAATPADFPRVEAFLESGLDRRPVPVDWHRAYQQFADVGGHLDRAIARYDEMVKAEPADAALLYLRGRIEPDPKREEEFFRKAIEADPKLPWPWAARASRAMAAGRWDECLEDVDKAAGSAGNQGPPLGELVHVARLAKGDLEPLADEYRRRLQSEPMGGPAILFLGEVLTAQGKADEIDAEVSAWESRVPMEVRMQLLPAVRAALLFTEGDFAGCLEESSRPGPGRNLALRASALLALGKAEEAAADESLAPAWGDPWGALALATSLDLAGHPDEAKPWVEHAAAGLSGMTREERAAAAALRGDHPPALDDLGRIIIKPEDKALLLTALARRFPEKAPEYLEAAGRFNVRRIGPYPVVARAIEAGKAGAGAAGKAP